MTNARLVRLLRKHEILKFGVFKLRSGIESSYYCDIKETLGTLEILSEMVRQVLALIPKTTTCIACSGYGGITIASIVAYKKKLPLVLVRDKCKDHGTKKLTEGLTPTKANFVCIIDDVFTTGSSIRNTRRDSYSDFTASLRRPWSF